MCGIGVRAASADCVCVRLYETQTSHRRYSPSSPLAPPLLRCEQIREAPFRDLGKHTLPVLGHEVIRIRPVRSERAHKFLVMRDHDELEVADGSSRVNELAQRFSK